MKLAKAFLTFSGLALAGAALLGASLANPARANAKGKNAEAVPMAAQVTSGGVTTVSRSLKALNNLTVALPPD